MDISSSKCNPAPPLPRGLVTRTPLSRAMLLATVLAMATFLVDTPLEYLCDWIFTELGIPSRLDQIIAEQTTRIWISPLVLAPLVENAFCLLWLRAEFIRRLRPWWAPPLAVSFIAALFHVIGYWEPRYIIVTVTFFPMCWLIAYIRPTATGYWASVLMHALFNLLTMLQLRWL
jgi:membrane protease YdiL (CAAX protease family)